MNTAFTYSTTVKVELTMEQLANIIVHLGSDQQARLISLMAEVDFSIPCQLQAITDDEALTRSGRRLMELIGDYARPLPAGEVGPPSLKQQALDALEEEDDALPLRSNARGDRFALIRRALEQLDD